MQFCLVGCALLSRGNGDDEGSGMVMCGHV